MSEERIKSIITELIILKAKSRLDEQFTEFINYVKESAADQSMNLKIAVRMMSGEEDVAYSFVEGLTMAYEVMYGKVASVPVEKPLLDYVRACSKNTKERIREIYSEINTESEVEE